MTNDSLIVVHFLSAGLQSTVTRAAARAGADASTVAFATALTTLAIAGSLLSVLLSAFPDVLYSPSLTSRTLALGAIAFTVIGAAYFITSYARFQAQILLPTYVFEPLSRTHVLIVVPFAMLFLEREARLLEWLAIGAALIPLGLLLLKSPAGSHMSGWWSRAGILWVMLASVFAASLQITSKLIVDPTVWIAVPVLVFMVGSNAASAVVAALLLLGRQRPLSPVRLTFRYGVLAGVCNVVAFGSLLLFLVDGKASRIYSASAMSMLVPVAWGLVTRRDRKPTRWEMVAFASALIAIVLQSVVGG